MKKVIIGGTFDLFHIGHKALLNRAFELGNVTIGITSDKMAGESRPRDITAFKLRKREVGEFIKVIGRKAKIIEINDKYGPTLNEDFDYIVTSPETFETALLINDERERAGKKEIEIVKIEYVLAQDGNPVSSTRIFNGEIDREGKLLG